MTHRFNNVTFVHDGKQHLASGIATYSVEDGAYSDEQEASFDEVLLTEVLSPKGWVEKDKLAAFNDSVLVALNNDENLLRSLA